MHFRDVAICDNPLCGAILRITTLPGAISVPLQVDAFGSFIVCPRCEQRTNIEAADEAPPVLGSSTRNRRSGGR
jgi:hypothetical protein